MKATTSGSDDESVYIAIAGIAAAVVVGSVALLFGAKTEIGLGSGIGSFMAAGLLGVVVSQPIGSAFNTLATVTRRPAFASFGIQARRVAAFGLPFVAFLYFGLEPNGLNVMLSALAGEAVLFALLIAFAIVWRATHRRS